MSLGLVYNGRSVLLCVGVYCFFLLLFLLYINISRTSLFTHFVEKAFAMQTLFTIFFQHKILVYLDI